LSKSSLIPVKVNTAAASLEVGKLNGKGTSILAGPRANDRLDEIVLAGRWACAWADWCGWWLILLFPVGVCGAGGVALGAFG
jgi:hypothetical protein